MFGWILAPTSSCTDRTSVARVADKNVQIAREVGDDVRVGANVIDDHNLVLIDVGRPVLGPHCSQARFLKCRGDFAGLGYRRPTISTIFNNFQTGTFAYGDIANFVSTGAISRRSTAIWPRYIRNLAVSHTPKKQQARRNSGHVSTILVNRHHEDEWAWASWVLTALPHSGGITGEEGPSEGDAQ